MSTPTETKPATGQRRPLPLVIWAIFAVVVVGVATAFSVRAAEQGEDIRANMTYLAPAGPGGGWDTFMREMQQADTSNNLVGNVQVVNVPGAAGTIGLGRISTMEGDASSIMVTGAGLVAGVEQLNSPVSHDDVTPIARVVEEYDVVVVPADSPYDSIDDLVADWQKDPGSIVWTGGGSFDQLVMSEFALAAEVDPAKTSYLPNSGGGEATQALITGTADAATSGYQDVADQIESGRLKALGLAAPQRMDGVDISTLSEQGYEVDLANWRAIVAPPGISDEERENLTELVRETIETPEWQNAVDRNSWTENYLDGPELETFLNDERTRIAGLYEEMGV
ncbi:tripartite tricarboxylate transporter substrate binding protein [Kocuria soli]|uniref:tripartite tricarboxylate transporter substrate binding protein n=1 Tax=Kocuria soli TaxID=2485125 RepID=UPI001F38F254|nr:tripartite tricarboxylate transporter substrate-binding protein [Kocuria soli]